MTGTDIIALVILVALAIAIAVYLLHWLYRRSSKEVSFVRTGLGGEKVVLSGGAFVLPIVHSVTPVGMQTLRIEIRRGSETALITRDRMRVELVVEFFLRVRPDIQSVSTAARSLGKKTMNPEKLGELIKGRFINSLGSMAADMTLEEIQSRRSDYAKSVKALSEESLSQTGLELEAVSLTNVDQTALSHFNPSNAFDAEGLTTLTEQIEKRKKIRNDIEQDTKISIRKKNLESEQMALEIERQSEFNKLQQDLDVRVQRSKQQTELSSEQSINERTAEQIRIQEEELIERARIQQEKSLEAERSLRETTLTKEIEERRQLRNEIEQNTQIEIRKKNLEAEKISLNLARELEYERLNQKQEIAFKKAQQQAHIACEEAQREFESGQAQIQSTGDIEKLQINKAKLIDAERIQTERELKLLEIEKQKELQTEEQNRVIALSEKSQQLLQVMAKEEEERAKTTLVEQKVTSVREMEVAEHRKQVKLVEASQQVEREAIQLTTLAKAEKEAAEQRAEAEQFSTLAAKLRYEIDALGKTMLNKAENTRSDESRQSELRMQLARNLDSIIRESVKPLQNIEGIKIMEVNGLPGFSQRACDGVTLGVDSEHVHSGEKNLANSVVNSALRYRAQVPFLDSLLKEIGMSGGEINNIKSVLGDYEQHKKDDSSDEAS